MLSDVDVVVHHGLVEEGARLHDDVRPHHRVLADLDVRLDLGVVADVQRPAQHGVGVDLRSFGDPHTG